jgi:ketosteroid isomerase-like protein
MRLLSTLVFMCVSLAPIRLDGQDRTQLPAEEVRKILELSESFTRGVLARDWKAVGALYLESAVLYPAGESAVKGRTGIEACLAGLPSLKDFKLRNTRVEGRDDVAYVHGSYTMMIATRAASDPVEVSGYYLEVRRRQPDGRWLIAVHMLNAHD